MNKMNYLITNFQCDLKFRDLAKLCIFKVIMTKSNLNIVMTSVQ